MPQINTLTQQMRSLEEQLVTCMKCGMCQSVCPLFEQTRKEADVARGKLVLLESLMKQILNNPDGVNERLNKCLLCGSCAANCPSGVNILEIFIKARAIITGYQKLPFVKKIIFRKMLAQPRVFDRIMSFGSKLQKFVLTRNPSHTDTADVKLISPLLKNRRVIPVADRFFQESVDELLKGQQTSGLKVALFTGCLIDKLFPQVGIASVKTLLHHNVRLHLPRHQGCCGIPALSAGDTRSFLDLVKYNLELFPPDDIDYLVTACATCTSTIKKLWPMMVKESDPLLLDQVEQLSEKTLDISQLLVQVVGLKNLGEKTNPEKETVTYHDPCHLAKSLGIRKEPREMIHASKNFELKEMADPDRCCGMGGSFNLYHYDISAKIGNIKRENIEATGCKTIATSCPACMMQIADMLSRSNEKIDVKHPIELYANGIDQRK